MSSMERPPETRAITGAYIGGLLINRPEAIMKGIESLCGQTAYVDELPIDNPELVRSVTVQAADRLLEGDDDTERRMVFWRGIYLAYAITCHTRRSGWPRLREAEQTAQVETEADMESIIAGAYACEQNIPAASRIAETCSEVIDTSGHYPQTARLGLMAGFYLLDNGDREILAERKAVAEAAERDRINNQFAKIQTKFEELAFEDMVRHYDDPAEH